MSSDTGPSELTERERKAIRAARGVDDSQQIIIVREGSKGSDGGFSKLKDGVFVLIVVGIGGITWTNSISQAATNARLETTVGLLQKSVSDLTEEVKALQQRIKP